MNYQVFASHTRLHAHALRSFDDGLLAAAPDKKLHADLETDVLACIPHEMYTYV
jgi:hypothetical protein